MAKKNCQNCGTKSDTLIGHLVKTPNLSADIKMVCLRCKSKLSKKKG